MTDIYNQVLSILSNALNDTKVNRYSNVSADDIFKELKAHAITALPFETCQNEFDIPGELQHRWLSSVFTQMQTWQAVMNEQDALVSLMHSSNIPIVIIKGIAAGVNYPRPELRAVGDVDFLVNESDFKRANQIMIDNGFVLHQDDETVKYHNEYQKNGVVFEIHNSLGRLNEYPYGDVIIKSLRENISKPEYIHIEDYTVPIMPNIQNGLILLWHIVQHLREGLGLRQIIDWMMFVKNHINDSSWENEFEPLFKSAGLEKFAKIVTRMCQEYLGLSTDNLTWCEEADISVCTTLMEEVMNQGNFGRKRDIDYRGTLVFSGSENVGALFKKINKYGCENWKAVKKYPKLKYVAWIYQLFRYIKLAFTRENALKTLKSNMSEGNKRNKMFKDLGL